MAMNFEKFFRLVSYTSVFCGFFSLWISGTFGFVATGLFICVLFAGWFLEGSRWQISEKLGTGLIVLALPAYYFAWRYQVLGLSGGETVIAGILARMILSLTAVKLLQKKSDRDWIFLYLMSFFEVLLAAGLSISALYLASFLVYLLLTVCAVIAFEIRKTSRAIERKIAGESAANVTGENIMPTGFPVKRVPTIAVALIIFTVALAAPLFFMLPRVGGAGFGGNQGGLSTWSGFSDTVKLGRIGRIQQSDEVVMRIKSDGPGDSNEGQYFRGIALDTFDNQSWSKSRTGSAPFDKGDRELVQVGYAASRENLLVQTIYLEPLDTPVLFAVPRVVAVQGNFPVLYKDTYDALSYQRSFERVSYKVLSDRSRPPIAKLRSDDQPYPIEIRNYRALPAELDPRIAELAAEITNTAKNRYDKAAAIESYLQTNFGYTLEPKASGTEPLADFLFNVREGHCEYFATAMAVMLRTQGIATRIVNGFHGGEYNDAADVTIVRQRNAHAWVEVYFPREDTWIRFDPTPYSDQTAMVPTGISGAVHKYLEALETFWIQYFVAYDDNEQKSLARSVRNGFSEYQDNISSFAAHAKQIFNEWWADVRGDKGFQTSAAAIGYGIGYVAAAVLGILLLIWLFRKLYRLELWSRLWGRVSATGKAPIIDFYDRMQRLLASRGLTRDPFQTPLEFAYSTNIPEAVDITERYNRVRFGEKSLSEKERDDIEKLLQKLDDSGG